MVKHRIRVYETDIRLELQGENSTQVECSYEAVDIMANIPRVMLTSDLNFYYYPDKKTTAD